MSRSRLIAVFAAALLTANIAQGHETTASSATEKTMNARAFRRINGFIFFIMVLISADGFLLRFA